MRYNVEEIIKAIVHDDMDIVDHLVDNQLEYKEIINFSADEKVMGVMSTLIFYNKLDYFKKLLPSVDFNKESHRGMNVITEALVKGNANFIEAIAQYVANEKIPYSQWCGNPIDINMNGYGSQPLFRLDSTLDGVLYFDSYRSIDLLACIDKEFAKLELQECMRRLFKLDKNSHIKINEIYQYIKSNWNDVNEIKCNFVKMLYLFSQEDLDNYGYSMYLSPNKNNLFEIFEKYMSKLEAEVIKADLSNVLPSKRSVKL